MKPLVLFFILVFFAGCSSSEQSTDFTLPELLMQAPLPVFSERIRRGESQLRLDLKILVAKDGSVRDVVFLNGSGTIAWDTIAAVAIRQWRYSPARYNNQPIQLWLRQTAIVRFAEPLYIFLAEIVCNTQEAADSAYNLLEHGSHFAEVTLLYSVVPSREKKGVLGEINIGLYTETIKRILADLEIEHYSKPVKYGSQYVIFKRLMN